MPVPNVWGFAGLAVLSRSPRYLDGTVWRGTSECHRPSAGARTITSAIIAYGRQGKVHVSLTIKGTAVCPQP